MSRLLAHVVYCNQGEVEAMLRIETRSETPQEITYALAGKVTGEHLPELAELLAAARAGNRRVTLDLGAVVLVDRETVRFLAAGGCAGVEIANCPAYVLSWIRCEGQEKGREKEKEEETHPR